MTVRKKGKKKAWRKSLHRIETWKGKRVKVTRNVRGRFVTWRKVRHYTRGATAKTRWRTTATHARAQTVTRPMFFGKSVAVYAGNKRIQMYGTGTNLYEAMKYAIRHPPREQFLEVEAGELAMHPDRYLERGCWHGRPEVVS